VQRGGICRADGAGQKRNRPAGEPAEDGDRVGGEMTPSGILESALYVDDLDAAEAFYGEVLGLERIAKVEGRHVFFRCGDGVLLLFDADQTVKPPKPGAKLPVPPHGAKGDGHLCFRGTAAEIERFRTHLEA